MSKIQRIKWGSEGSTRAGWLKMRNDLLGDNSYDTVRFGSSEIGVICGMNEWSSPRRLWYNKLGMHRTDINSFKLLAGQESEPLIAKYYESWDPNEEEFVANCVNGIKVRKLRKAKYFMINDRYPFLLSSIDYTQPQSYPCPFTGEIIKGGMIVELKNIGEFNFKNWNGELPLYYKAQVIQQQMVSGTTKGVLVAYVGGCDLKVFEVDYDKELADLIDYKTTEFGLSVLKGKAIMKLIEGESSEPCPSESYLEDLWGLLHELEPPVMGTKAEKDFLEDDLWPESNDLVMQGGEKEGMLMTKYLKATRLEGELKKAKLLYRNQLTDILTDFEYMEADGIKLTNRRGREGKKDYFSIARIK